jgi:hypothetical protein
MAAEEEEEGLVGVALTDDFLADTEKLNLCGGLERADRGVVEMREERLFFKTASKAALSATGSGTGAGARCSMRSA